MTVTTRRPARAVLPPLESLVLQDADVPGFHRLFSDSVRSTNESVAARAGNPARQLRCLEEWSRIDGYAVRHLPDQRQAGLSCTLVIDSSAARFERGAGALQALNDEASFPETPGVSRLFPRNIADNTESVYDQFEEDGVKFALYRVDFRVANILGSVGAVWRRPHGGPLEVLALAERQSARIRSALQRAGSPYGSVDGKQR